MKRKTFALIFVVALIVPITFFLVACGGNGLRDQDSLSINFVQLRVGETFQLATGGGSGTGDVTFELLESGTATAIVSSSGYVSEISSHGTLSIRATKAADSKYKSAIATRAFDVAVSAPKNLRMEGSILRWDEVPGATEYTIGFENWGRGISEPFYDIAKYELRIGEVMQFSIYARDGNLRPYSLPAIFDFDVDFTQLNPPQNIEVDLDASCITWDTVPFASRYRITLYDEHGQPSPSVFTVNTNRLDFGSSAVLGGNKTLRIEALRNPTVGEIINCPIEDSDPSEFIEIK